MLGQTPDSQGPVAQPCLHSIPGFQVGRRLLRSEPPGSLCTGRGPPGGLSGEHWPQFLCSLGRAPGEGVRVGIHLILAHPAPRGTQAAAFTGARSRPQPHRHVHTMPSQASGKSLGFSGPLGRLRLNRWGGEGLASRKGDKVCARRGNFTETPGGKGGGETIEGSEPPVLCGQG